MENETNISSSGGQHNMTLLLDYNGARLVFNIPAICFLFTIMIVGAIGNSIVLTVCSTSSVKSSANFYIMILACIDMINCCFCIPFQIYDLWNPYINSLPTLCCIERFVENVSNLLNGFILICVASERYKKVCFPLQQYTLKTAKELTVIVSILAISLSWPQLVINGRQTIEVGKEKVIGEDCSYNDAFQNSIYVLLFQGLLFVVYIVAFLLCAFFYANITIVIIKRKRLLKKSKPEKERVSASESSACSPVKLSSLNEVGCVNGRIQMRSSKTTLCLVSVSVAAIISYVPYLAVQTIRTSGEHLQTTITVTGEFYHYGSSFTTDLLCTLAVKSYFLNSALNPIIYSAMNPRFRAKVKSVFKKVFTKLHILSCSKREI